MRSDVKPENLLCSRVGGVDVVKLADFGSAVQLPPEGVAAVDPVAQGTTLYSPPEVLHGQSYSCAADVWAAGITTYVLISGYFPFGCTADALSAYPCFDGESWAGVSLRARDFVTDLLQHDPAFRPSAEEAQRLPWLRDRLCETPPPRHQQPTSPRFLVLLGGQQGNASASAAAAPPAHAPLRTPAPAQLRVPDHHQADEPPTGGFSWLHAQHQPSLSSSADSGSPLLKTASPAAPPAHTPLKKRGHARNGGMSSNGNSGMSTMSEAMRWPAKKRPRSASGSGGGARDGGSSRSSTGSSSSSDVTVVQVVATASVDPVVAAVPATPLNLLNSILWGR